MKTKACAGIRIKKGFTFIELLISVVIVSFVGAAVYGILSNGIKIWRRSGESRVYDRDIRLVLEKFAGELRSAFELSTISFEGEKEFLRFPSLIDVSSQGPYAYRVGRVTYFFDDDKGGLYRKQESYSEVLKGEVDDEEDGEEEYDSGKEMETIKKSGSIQKLAAGIKEIEFSYCYLDNVTGKYRWKDDWKKEEQDSIPKAVTIRLLFEEDSGEEQELNRTVFVPLGTGEQKITIGTATTTILDEIKDE